jgi:hypothetical protein
MNMKKFLNLIIASLLFVGCATFETYEPEAKGDLPATLIEVDPLSIMDSVFNLKVTPGAGTNYYSVVVIASKDTIEIDGYNLLKGSTYKGILSQVISKSKTAVFESNMRKADNTPLCLPNTTYQIYAVSGNEKGVVGEVKQLTIKTTDAKIPGPKTFAANAANKSISVTFSEVINRGTGAVTATYYKEFDLANPIIVTLESANMDFAGNVVTFSLPDAPNGAFVNINWEAGAFKDGAGNLSGAYTTKGFNPTTGAHTGIRFRVPTVSFDIKDTYFVSPAVGSTFVDWATFEGVITFEKNIYRIASKVKAGDLSVIYKAETKTTTVQLPVSKWSVSEASLKFALPEAPTPKDGVTLNIKAGVLFDEYGNPNAAYDKTAVQWTMFEFKKEMLFGTFSFSGVSTSDGKTYDEDDSFTIEEDTEKANSLIIKGFMVDNAANIKAAYDLDTRKVYLNTWDSLGLITLSGTVYEMYLYNHVATSSATIAFDINPDRTLVSKEFALVVYNPVADKTYIYDKYNPATFTPVATPAAIRKPARVKSNVTQNHLKLIINQKIIDAFHKMK